MVAWTTRGPELCFISMPEDRYVAMVEAAADEAIATAGPEWATLLPEALDSAGKSLDGLVCDLAERPLFSAAGPVLGIGYPCEPFDRIEPEEVWQLDLIASPRRTTFESLWATAVPALACPPQKRSQQTAGRHVTFNDGLGSSLW